MSNTGRGNYPASKPSVAGKQLKEAFKSVPKVKFPNRATTETSYKRGMKKHEGSE